MTRKGFVAEVLEVSPRGAPRAVAFHFDKPLESRRWFGCFSTGAGGATAPFVLPQIGETVEIAGPRGWRRGSRGAVGAGRTN